MQSVLILSVVMPKVILYPAEPNIFVYVRTGVATDSSMARP
jgi:hypothetical protein